MVFGDNSVRRLPPLLRRFLCRHLLLWDIMISALSCNHRYLSDFFVEFYDLYQSTPSGRFHLERAHISAEELLLSLLSVSHSVCALSSLIRPNYGELAPQKAATGSHWLRSLLIVAAITLQLRQSNGRPTVDRILRRTRPQMKIQAACSLPQQKNTSTAEVWLRTHRRRVPRVLLSLLFFSNGPFVPPSTNGQVQKWEKGI